LRFFWEWIDNFPGTAIQKEEFRQIIISVIGWVPENIVPARIQELERMTEDADEMIAHDKKSENLYTRSLKEAITNARGILKTIQKEKDKSSKRNVRNAN